MDDAVSRQDFGWFSRCTSAMSTMCAFDGDFRQFLLDLDCPQLLSEITEHEKVNGNGESNLNKKGQSSDSCLNPARDKKSTVSNPVSQRNVYNRSQSLPTTSLSNTAQHRIIYRNGHFVIETDHENRDGEEAFEELDEDLSLESVEDAEQLKTKFNSGRSYSEANLTDSYHSRSSALYDDDEDIEVFMRNENDVTVIENNNDGSSPNWHVLVKRRTKEEGHDSENRKSRPLSVDESQLQTSRMESDPDEQSSSRRERKRPSENVKRRSASFRELGTAKLQRNSSFRKAQERGYPHSMTDARRNDSVGNLSLTPSEYSMCSDSGRSKGSGFFQKVFKKNKPSEKYTDPSKNKDSGNRKMSLRGLFTKKSKGEFVSQRSIDELISPPIAVFQGDMDIHVDSAPNSPYSSQFRRRHTSAEIYDGKAHSLPRKPADYQKSFKLTNENSSSSRLLSVQNLENHPKRPISPKPSNVLIPRRNSNVSLPSSPIRDQCDGPFKTSMSKLDSDSASICSGGSSIVEASRYPPHIPESEMTPSNSNDSGIQRDVSFHSSSESIKRSRGQKQRYACNCSSVDSNQFKTLSIHKSCECELAWMVKRSESLRENTFRYSENGCNASKTNLYGSKSLPSTPLPRSSQRDFALTKSAHRGTPVLGLGGSPGSRIPELGLGGSGLGGSPGSLGETIREEQEPGTASRPEWFGVTDGQAVDHFHFTGEDTSLFDDHKEISLLKPQVSPESAAQEELEDHVGEENQFSNVSVNEDEVFFTFTGSDTSLLERTNTAASTSSSKTDLGESDTDMETESLGRQEVKQHLHTISKPHSCNEADFDKGKNEILGNSGRKLSMEPRQVNSVPVSLSTSFTGSMDESNVDPERPKSLYRELSRIGNMSLVQSKLMSWKAMEEQYTEPNGKQLLPFGCSGTPKRKNSKASREDEDLSMNLEIARRGGSLQGDELDVALFSVMESRNDYINGEQDDKNKEGSESPIVPIEDVQVESESESDEIVQSGDRITCDTAQPSDEIVQSGDRITCDTAQTSDEIVQSGNRITCDTAQPSDEIVQSGDRITCDTAQPSDRLETVQSDDEIGAFVLGDKNDQSDSLENYDLGDVEVEGVKSELLETAQDSTANVIRRRKSPSPRPERPKSEISVRWADLEESREITPVKRRESSRRSKQRPKSDLEDNIQLFDEMYEDVIDDYDFLTGGSSLGEDDMKPYGSHLCLLPYSSLQNLEKLGQIYSYDQKPSMRRMSTPHPIKTRLERTPRKQRRRTPLVRSHSMPESLDKLGKRKKFLSTIASSNLHREDMLCHYDNDSSSDEGSEFSTDQISLHEKSLTSRLHASYLSTLRERPEPDTLTYAEALWDHITMDPEELGFRAGDVIEVADMSDKDWWWGAIDDREGWFPATFVRLRVNQEHSDLGLHPEDILEHSSPVNRRISVINTDQARANVVNEIINAEREYVKHLKDVVEGYIRHARKREDMFSEDRISVIFGNMEDIYEFSQKFLESIENSFVIDNPHQSQLGHCFLECSKEFEIYSDYCNNHPSASGELKDLYRNKKYRHFFEACRLLQEMIEIPLEGFLLTPVQKICKYPLQLNELLKYTPVTHPDHGLIQGALDAMKKIATLINERKRKMESIEKLAYWQTTVEDWQGPDLLEDSSELIFAGEMNKVNSAGWSQERNFFLFDHQLVYCKKDLLKKNGYSYKGRIDLDDSEIVDVEDGKDTQYNVTVKNAWKIHEVSREKWYLLVARSTAEKEKWMKAFTNERKRVKEDQENNFVPLYWKRMVLNKIKTSQEKLRAGGQINYEKDFVRGMPSHATLPRSYGKKIQKKKGWFGFGNKKTK